MRWLLPALLALCAWVVPGLGAAQSYSAPAGLDHPRRVFWGDTHLHTRNSADAYSLGNRNLTAVDAYRFARGEELVAHNGMRVRLRRPLDFLVVSDHAEFLAGYYRFNVGDPLVVDTDVGRRWAGYVAAGEAVRMMGEFTGSINDPESHSQLPDASKRLIWRDVAETADDYNEPGRFTAFTGYEWTSMIDGDNLHRVVVYRDSADQAAQLIPFSAQDSTDPEALWQALAAYEAATGGRVMAIPHNGNLSNGAMFALETLGGRRLSRPYAETRARWEPIVEVTQVKGDGEAHPLLSPDDEFADYETWDQDNIGRTQAKRPEMLQHEYARGALKLGLQLERRLGANPFKFGMIGSTDSHTALATAAEDNFFGKFPGSEPGVERTRNAMAGQLWENWRIAASGYAAVWAQENTRQSLWAALERREVYATTGSRIVVRLFGGFDFQPDDAERPDYVDVGYARGVPMGGDLTRAPDGGALSLLITAARDPDGAHLDRVQVVKGWLDRGGELHERVYDVALSDGRSVDPQTGKAPPVGSTVDVARATYRNSIGAAQLATVWRDPDFDPSARAFYYVRVLEIPTPRWTAYDARHFQLELPPEIPMVQQDRAYTSPIWYTP